MTESIKRGKGSKMSPQDGIDLSAGFVPTTPQAASEPSPRELTPDSFMAQQTNPSAVPAELTFDAFMGQQAPFATDGGEAGPIDGKPISCPFCIRQRERQPRYDLGVAAHDPAKPCFDVCTCLLRVAYMSFNQTQDDLNHGTGLHTDACQHAYLCGILRAMKEKKFSASEFARIGGKARARKLTPEQRRSSARKAAQARWAKKKKDVDNG